LQESKISEEHALEFLLAFNGRIHILDQGYWLKFEISRVEPTPNRPHGVRYSLTLHDPEGERLLGFDNAHAAPRRGAQYKAAPIEYDHWHRTSDDPGRPYAFTTVDQLLADFEAEVDRILSDCNVRNEVTDSFHEEDPSP
jgi:hypothetical protein